MNTKVGTIGVSNPKTPNGPPKQFTFDSVYDSEYVVIYQSKVPKVLVMCYLLVALYVLYMRVLWPVPVIN